MEAETDDDRVAFGRRLEEHRTARGISFNKLSRLVYDRVGAYAPTAETLRIYHHGGKEPEKADLVVVAALADVYGVRISHLSPTVAARIEATDRLLRNRWTKKVAVDASSRRLDGHPEAS